MNRRFAIQTLTLFGVAGWTSGFRGRAFGEDKQDDEKDDEIPLKDVPAEIRKAADAAVPKATWETAYRNEEDGEVTFELEGTDAKGRDVVVVLTKDAKVEVIETEIPVKEVPEVVTAALKAKWPRFKVSAVHELQQEGKVVGYDFEGKRQKDKHEIGIFVSADGKEAEIDEDE